SILSIIVYFFLLIIRNYFEIFFSLDKTIFFYYNKLKLLFPFYFKNFLAEFVCFTLITLNTKYLYYYINLTFKTYEPFKLLNLSIILGKLSFNESFPKMIDKFNNL